MKLKAFGGKARARTLLCHERLFTKCVMGAPVLVMILMGSRKNRIDHNSAFNHAENVANILNILEGICV